MGKKTLKDLFQRRCKPSQTPIENIQSSSEAAETLPQQQGSRQITDYYPDQDSDIEMIESPQKKQEINLTIQKKKEANSANSTQKHQSHDISKIQKKFDASDQKAHQSPKQHVQKNQSIMVGQAQQILGSSSGKQSSQVKEIQQAKDIDKVNIFHNKQAKNESSSNNSSQKEQNKSPQAKAERQNRRKNKTKNKDQKAEQPKSQRNLRPKNGQINYKESFNNSLIRVPKQTVRQKQEANKRALNQPKGSSQQFSQHKMESALEQRKSSNEDKMDVQSLIWQSLNGLNPHEQQINGQHAFETPAKPSKNRNSNNKNKARENNNRHKGKNALTSQNYNSIFNQIRAKVVSDIRLQMAQNNNPVGKSNNLTNPPSAQEMPELALRCAEFFHSLSKYCLSYYQNYNREQANQKTKRIHKLARPKKLKQSNRSNDRNDGDKKNEKDQALPKKPLTAYIIYFQQKKPSFVEKYKGLNLSDLTKLIAKQWTELSQLEKQPYLDKASQDRKRYEQEMVEYRKKCGTITSQMNGQASDNDENVIQGGDDKEKNQGAIQIEQ